MGKSQRRKGYRGEYQLVKHLEEAGIPAVRIPLSGATEFQKGDVVIDGKVAEVKVRKDDFKRIYQWLKDKDLLFIKADRKDYLVVMRLDDFIHLYKRMLWMMPVLWRTLEELVDKCEGVKKIISRYYHHWVHYAGKQSTNYVLATARTVIFLYWACPDLSDDVIDRMERVVKETLARKNGSYDFTKVCKFRYKKSCLFGGACDASACPIISRPWRELGIKLREIITPDELREMIP